MHKHFNWLLALMLMGTLSNCSSPRSAAHARNSDPHAYRDAVQNAPARATLSHASSLTQEDDIRIAAYRFDIALHGSDADREEFGGIFVDYPAEREGAYLLLLSQGSPPVRPKRLCAVTADKGIVDLATGMPAISEVAVVEHMDDHHAIVQLTWWSDPECGAAMRLGLERFQSQWEVTGVQILWAR